MLLPMLLEKTKLLPLYVTGIGIKPNQNEIIREKGFHEYQILYCTEGSGIFKTEGKEYKICKGDAFFFRPYVPHEYRPVKSPWKTKWITYSGTSAESIADYLGFGKTDVFTVKKLNDLDMLTTSIYEMCESDVSDKEIKISWMLYKIIIKLGACRSNIPQNGGMTQKEKFQKLAPVIELMKNECSADLSLEVMADEIGVTPNHLCRLFNQVYGVTPIKYLTQLRINTAKNFLCSQNEMKIGDIALKTGFHDASYFCSVFKKNEGMTPEEFRRFNTF